MTHHPLPPGFWLAFPLGFVLFWWLVLQLVAWLSGWSKLARSYGAEGMLSGRQWNFCSARIGKINYNNCLVFAANAEGVYLAPYLPWRFGHRRLFVPWRDVQWGETSGRWFRRTELRFAAEPSVRLKLAQELAAQLREAQRGPNAPLKSRR